MKAREFALSVLLNLFLGYLWILFVDHIVSIANAMNHTVLFGGFIIFIGTVLFGEIVKRITPFHEYKFTNPVKLAGFFSFALVVIVHICFSNVI